MAANQTALDFANAARLLGREARRRGLVAPSFRCPPRIVGVQRSIRRHGNGAVVAVQLKGRPWLAVLGDMIEGIVVVNELTPPRADRVRSDLWAIASADPTVELERPAEVVAAGVTARHPRSAEAPPERRVA